MFPLTNLHSRIAVACSGGIDSLALLIYLKQNKFDVIALHVNHGAQERSQIMSNELREICLELQIPFVELKISVKKFTQHEMRNARYEALINFCQKNNYLQLCTGHTLNDQIENFTIRLLRGAGVLGLSKMKNIILDGIQIVRPLLNVKKEVLQKFLLSQNLSWVNDVTNESNKYLRNFLRLEILPKLNQHNLEISLNNISLCANFIQNYIEKLLKTSLKIRHYGLVIVEHLANEDEFIQNEVVNYLLHLIDFNITRISIKHHFYGQQKNIYIAFDDNLYLLILNSHQEVAQHEFIYNFEDEKKMQFNNKILENRFKFVLNKHLQSCHKANQIIIKTNNYLQFLPFKINFAEI